MKYFFYVFIFIFPISSDASVNSKLFDELESPSINLSHLQKNLSNRHVIMWAGFNNERLPNYFQQNIKTLKNELNAGKISGYWPSSAKDIFEVAQQSYTELLRLYAIGGRKPLIIIAHSKGGAESLLTLLLYPQLVTSGVVDYIISVQGAIGGTPLTNLYFKWAKPLIPIWALPILAVLDDGLFSMTPTKAHQVFDWAVSSLNPNLRRALTNKIFYVRSMFTVDDKSPVFNVSRKYLNKYGPNDGVILTEDMQRSDIGIDLGILHANHSHLVSADRKPTQKSVAYRSAFTKALFRQIYEK